MTDVERGARRGLSAREVEGLALGMLGVLAFSMTLPATRVAATEMGGTLVGLGRAVVAALLAALLLAATRQRVPERRHWGGLAIVVLGVVVGFPLFSALALASLPAAHAAVVVGLLPAATAVAAVARGHERPPLVFWLGCGLGVVAVLAFAVAQGAGLPRPADGLLLVAVALGGLGYAEGGRISRELGSWRVICWALVMALPFVAVPVIWVVARDLAGSGLHMDARGWAGFAYVSVVSMFLGFFPWYRGLAIGGVARVGQLQLVQPVLTLAWSAWLLHERVSTATVLAALLVIASAGASVAARPRGQNGRLGSAPSLSGLTARAAESEVGNADRRS
ncbi:MAG TPA: DMT family transporter [Candidatus Dormibacteraeota bacterium]|nr:DMT family transporter [Candidatus Dormibacteraeota bacterium]